MTRVNVTGTFDMIAMPKIRSGPLIAIWMTPGGSFSLSI